MAQSLSFNVLIFLLHFIVAMGGNPYYKEPVPDSTAEAEDLTFGHYARTCPNLEAIVHHKVKHWIDYTLAASLIRLHFHDCAVRHDEMRVDRRILFFIFFHVCDASILLNHPGSKRHAKASKTLRGFEVIDDIKATVEKKCPRTVSCADILTAVARDATLKIGGPFWEVAYGRKDGVVSMAREAELVPMGHENVTHLIELFQSKGLNLLDLVVLSGNNLLQKEISPRRETSINKILECNRVKANRSSHHWKEYMQRNTGQTLQLLREPAKPDPLIDGKYLNFLKRKCRWASEYVDFDPMTPTKFDSMYYSNLQRKMGLLSSDQLLYSDSRTEPVVAALATQPKLFYQQFAVSMVNLGNAQVLIGDDEGEIRTNCNFVDS